VKQFGGLIRSQLYVFGLAVFRTVGQINFVSVIVGEK
jgi:hypothetical protein